jgi:hypothetical protein
MKLEQLENTTQGKNFSVAEALHIAYRCGMDAVIETMSSNSKSHVTEATMLAYVVPRVCRLPNAEVHRAVPAPVHRLVRFV